MPINNYSFDGLYRRHHPLDPYDDDHHHRLDHSGGREEDSEWRFHVDPLGGSGGKAVRGSSGAGGGACHPPTAAGPVSGAAGGGGSGCAGWYAKRMETILREEYGTFFDGMTRSARELYQVHTTRYATAAASSDLTFSFSRTCHQYCCRRTCRAACLPAGLISDPGKDSRPAPSNEEERSKVPPKANMGNVGCARC